MLAMLIRAVLPYRIGLEAERYVVTDDEANVDPLVVDEADHKRTAALEAARQFDATPPPTAEGDAVGNQAAGAAAMHSGEGSRQWAA